MSRFCAVVAAIGAASCALTVDREPAHVKLSGRELISMAADVDLHSPDGVLLRVQVVGHKGNTLPVSAIISDLTVSLAGGGTVVVEPLPEVERPYVGMEEQTFKLTPSAEGLMTVTFKVDGLAAAPTPQGELRLVGDTYVLVVPYMSEGFEVRDALLCNESKKLSLNFSESVAPMTVAQVLSQISFGESEDPLECDVDPLSVDGDGYVWSNPIVFNCAPYYGEELKVRIGEVGSRFGARAYVFRPTPVLIGEAKMSAGGVAPSGCVRYLARSW